MIAPHKKFMNAKSRNIPKYKVIKRYLLEVIEKMVPGLNRLETEEVLSANKKASKATIRQAMNELIADDLITRIQGKGMFGRPNVNHLKMRIDKTGNFLELLVKQGYRVSVFQDKAEELSPSESMRRRFSDHIGDTVYA